MKACQAAQFRRAAARFFLSKIGCKDIAAGVADVDLPCHNRLRRGLEFHQLDGLGTLAAATAEHDAPAATSALRAEAIALRSLVASEGVEFDLHDIAVTAAGRTFVDCSLVSGTRLRTFPLRDHGAFMFHIYNPH